MLQTAFLVQLYSNRKGALNGLKGLCSNTYVFKCHRKKAARRPIHLKPRINFAIQLEMFPRNIPSEKFALFVEFFLFNAFFVFFLRLGGSVKYFVGNGIIVISQPI